MASSSSGTNSISNFGVTFVINFVILLCFVVGFLFLRPLQKRIYQPRSTIETISSGNRPRPLKSGIFNWFKDLVTRREAEILQDAGLDGYFFLRYLRLIFIISIVGVLFVCTILLPVNGTGGNGNSGFNLLSFQNVKDTKRYYAHVFVGWVYFGFIIFTLYRELLYYLGIRQAVLTSPAYSGLVSSRTILISTVPEELLAVEPLTEMFDGVKYIWMNRDFTDLSKKVKEREKLAIKVEGAETKLLKLAVKNRLKSEKSSKISTIEGDEISNYVPDKKRPTHKLKFLIGKKVDTIEYGREHIQELNTEISEMRSDVTKFPVRNSVFICFHTQEQAETAVQTLAYHQALHMSPRYIGLLPNDIIWSNLRLFWWERWARSIGACSFIIALVIFWCIPVAFVGSISNIDSLIEKLPWLSFLNHIPSFIYGVVSGFLPSILLAVLMALLPIILRAMAKIAGAPSGTLVEYYVQNAYFAFQVVQVFLVTTISSGAASVVQSIINDPSSAMSLLADNLPKASNFYISYFLLQGFTIAGGALLQIVALILFHIFSTLLDNTPRKKWNRWTGIGTTGWGTVFPVYANLAVISITYSIITPILLAFTALAFGCVYLAYLHNLLFVLRPSEGRGIFYPRAVFQTFTGLYLGEICLLGLFVVAKAWGPLGLQVVLLVATVLVHVALERAFKPLLNNIPRNLLRKAAAAKTQSSGLYGGNDLLEQASERDEYQLQQKSSLFEKPEDRKTRDESISSGAVPITSQSNLESGEHGGHNPTAKISLVARYFKPHVFLDPRIIQREFLTFRLKEAPPALPEDVESGAYANPAITADDPVVWIPRDPWGLSQAEVREMREHGVNGHDDGAWFEITEQKKKKKVDLKCGTVDSVPVWSPTPEY